MQKFNNALLEGKKAMFIEKVKEISKLRNLDISLEVVFQEGFINQKKEIRACIDIENKIIYVSLQHLKIMSFEDIDETVNHEIEHLFIPNHGPVFIRETTAIKIINPPIFTGVRRINGGAHVDKYYKIQCISCKHVFSVIETIDKEENIECPNCHLNGLIIE